MLYNKNQFRKTNDKKVLHKIGKHWVTVSVAFLSLLGLGAVSTTATTHADTTDNAKAQTTSAAPNSNSADSIQKQVTKQANALHNQLLGHAAVSQKPAQQGTARLGSVNGRVNQAQTQNTQQNNKPANNRMSANHSNVMRLGANNAKPTPPNNEGRGTDPTKPLSDYTAGQVQQIGTDQLGGLTYRVWSDTTPKLKQIYVRKKTYEFDPQGSDDERSSRSIKYIIDSKDENNGSDSYSYQIMSKWLKQPTNLRFPHSDKGQYQGKYDKLTPTTSHNDANWKLLYKLYFNPDGIDSWGDYYGTLPYWIVPAHYENVIAAHNYRLEITSKTPATSNSNLSNLLKQISNKYSTKRNHIHFVSVQIDKGVDTSKAINMSNMFSNDSDLRNISGLSNLDTSNTTNMSNMFTSDSKLTNITGISDWNTSKVQNMSNMFLSDTGLQNISDMNYTPATSKAFDNSKWNLKSVNNISGMFMHTNALTPGIIDQLNTWRFEHPYLAHKEKGVTSTDLYYNSSIESDVPAFNSDTTIKGKISFNKPSDSNGDPYTVPASDVNGTQTYKLPLSSVPALDTDTVLFKDLSDESNDDIKTFQGANNTQKYVPAPSDEEYINGSTGNFTFSGIQHIRYVKSKGVLEYYRFSDTSDPKDPINKKILNVKVPWHKNYKSSKVTIPVPSDNYYYPKGSNNSIVITQDSSNTKQTPQVLKIALHQFQGLNYKYNSNSKTVEFVSGTYRPSAEPTITPTEFTGTFSLLAKVTNSDIFKAKNIKFDSDVNLNNQTPQNPDAPTEYKGMFWGMPNLKSVDMSAITDESLAPQAWDMQYMFANDKKLITVKFPKYMKLSDVDNISYLFSGDSDLHQIDFGYGFDKIGNSISNGSTHFPNKVDMDGIFEDTPKLTLLPRSATYSDTADSWIKYDGHKHSDYTDPLQRQPGDTGFSDMTHAFDKFDTSHAISMNHMFSDTGIVHLHVPFRTSDVQSMNYMFSNNDNGSSLSSISFGPKFTTKNVTSMQGMFMNDSFNGGNSTSDAIYDLKLQNGQFNTSNVTNMKDMFAGDSYLTGLQLPATFDTQKVTDMSNMFAGLGGHYNTSGSTNGIGAQYHKLDLKLPINFYIPKGGSTNMFGKWNNPDGTKSATAGLHSLTLTSNNKPVLGSNGKPILASDKKTELFHTNTVFSDKPTSATTSSSLISPTNIVPLYEQEPTDQYGDGTLITNINDGNDYSGDKRLYNPKTKTYDYYMPYTLNTPHDFTSGIAGTYMPKNSIPEKLAFSDVFSNNDSYTQHGSKYLNDKGLDWRLNKDPENNPILHDWSQAPSGWTFVTPSDSFSLDPNEAAFHKNPTTGSDRVLVAPLYHGLVLRYDASDKTAEFVAGPITTSDTMASFDNINAPHPYNNDDTYGEQTINRDVKNASTIEFDMVPREGLSTIHGVTISNISDMSYMFANPNLKHLIFDNGSKSNRNGEHTIDTSKTTNMEGMFQGANISDLTLPSDFVTTKVNNMTNMFAEGNGNNKATNGKDGQPSSSLKSLTVTSPDTRFKDNSITKMPTLYRVLNSSDGKGNHYTDNNWTKFGSLNSKDAVGTYVASPDYAPVSDTINFDLTKSNGQKVTVGTKKTGSVPAGTPYNISKHDVPSGYQFASDNHNVQLGHVTNSTYSVPVKPIHESDTVTFMYKPSNKQSYKIGRVYSPHQESDSDDFSGNDYADRQYVSDTSKTLDNSSEYVPTGWQLDKTKYPSNSVTVPYDGGSHTVYLTPVQVKQTFYYRDENQSDGANYGRVVGSSAVSGNSFAASQAGDNSLIVTKSNHSGLSAGYSLIYPSDDTADNTVEYTGVSDIYIPVRLDNGTENIHFQYSGSDVNTSAASFKGQPAGQISVTSGMASGYHLASGASTTVPEDNEAHNVSVTPNTITENISYAVQNNPQYATQGEKFSGFSSAIDDSRTKGKHKSFVLNSYNQYNNAMNLPNGFQVSGSYKFGPATTNIANSNSDHTVIVTPDHVHLSVDYFNDTNDAQHYINGSDNHIIASSEYSGLVGNHISIPLNVPKGYSMITPYGQRGSVYDVTNSDELNAMPTKFSPAPSDHVYIYVRPETATSRIQFVDASRDNANVGNPISVTGQSVNVPGTYNTGFDITNTSNTNYIPKGYVLVNQNNPVEYNNQNYTIPVVPANNNLAIDYQYNGQSVHSTMVHRTSPTATIKINSDYEPGLPAGYRLSDEHNVSDDNIFDDTKTSGNIAVVPLQQTDTINYQLNGKTIGVGHVSGNDARATYANGQPVSDTTVNVTNQTDGVPSGYHVVQNNDTLNVFGFDGQPHNVVVASNNTKETIEYMYKGVSRGSDQFFSAPGEKIDITSANATDMPSGYHLVNANNQFIANNGDHQIEIAPSTSTFTVNFVNNGKTVGTKQYTGATDTSFTVDGAADTPKGYTINKGQNMNYDFDGDETKDVASLNVTPIPPTMDTESINFIYSDANHQNHNEGSTVHTGVKGSVGTVTPSDYSALKSGWQIIPGENNSNKFFNYKFSDGSVNMFVEPIQQTEKVWFLNDQTGKLIGNDGPFSDTVMVTGNDYRAKDAGDNSFVIGATPNHLNLSYYKVDNPDQVIPFDGSNHGVDVHLVKQAPYSAEASAQAAKASASASVSISNAASAMAKKTNPSMASSYAKSAASAAASQIPSQAANSVASTNDSSEYSHEQSANSSIASSASSSAAQSQSSKNNSLNSSIAGKTSSESAAKSSSASSVAPSSSASVMPYIPFVPSSAPSSVSSSASSVASQSSVASSSAASVAMTNKNYPITYAKSANKPDMVTVMGRKYPVHYHSDGKNTVYARIRYVKNGRVHYRYRTVVVSTNVPTVMPSSDNVVRAIDHIDFTKTGKRVWTRKGLIKEMNSVATGKVVNYHGIKLAALNLPGHFRYFKMNRNALAHDLIVGKGFKRVLDMKTGHDLTVAIKRIFVIHYTHHNYVSYEFTKNGHDYWITGRRDFTPNAYWQLSNMKARHSKTLRVIHDAKLYTSPYYTPARYIKTYRHGTILHIKRIFYLGRNGKRYQLTRFQLTNGRYVTSNKNYVWLVPNRRARK